MDVFNLVQLEDLVFDNGEAEQTEELGAQNRAHRDRALVKSVGVAVAHRRHRSCDEVEGVHVESIHRFERLHLFRHPLAVEGSDVDPEAGEEVDHYCELAGRPNLANNIFDLQLLPDEDVLDGVLDEGERLRDSGEHQQHEHFEEDHHVVAATVDLLLLPLVVRREPIEHFVEEDRRTGQEVEDEVAEHEPANVFHRNLGEPLFKLRVVPLGTLYFQLFFAPVLPCGFLLQDLLSG